MWSSTPVLCSEILYMLYIIVCEVDVIANLLVLYLPFCSTLNTNFFYNITTTWVVSVFINVLLFYLLMIIESLWIKSIWNLVQFLKTN